MAPHKRIDPTIASIEHPAKPPHNPEMFDPSSLSTTPAGRACLSASRTGADNGLGKRGKENAGFAPRTTKGSSGVGYAHQLDQRVRLLNSSEARARLGIGRTSFFALLRDGRLHAVRLGRRTMIPMHELERFIATLPARD